MILPDLILYSFVNRNEDSAGGMDSLEYSCDKKHFMSYPYQIHYQYNSRGFRDSEWPDNVDELQNAIWCVGDSFTVGLGSPREHTWTHILEQKIGKRTINVSLNGASNEWISRQAKKIISTISPKVLILHWSYISRREVQDLAQARERAWQVFYKNMAKEDWPACKWEERQHLPSFIIDQINQASNVWNEDRISDEHRILGSINCSTDEDVKNTVNCINSVSQIQTSTKIIHSFIPHFTPAGIPGQIYSQIIKLQNSNRIIIPELQVLDWARDKHHYDVKTSCSFVEQLTQFL
jgi:hypothetical protein